MTSPNTDVFKVSVSTRLNLRARPSKRSKVLVTLENGQLLAKLDGPRDGEWLRVFADTPGVGAYIGYVSRAHLAPADDRDLNRAASAGGYGDEAATGDEEDRLPPGEGDDADLNSAWIDGWNPRVPHDRRHLSQKWRNRSGGDHVDQIIIHITGDTNFEVVRNRFMTQSASAHYLIMPDGRLHQFVSENKRAWHSGIKSFVDDVYSDPSDNWRKYKRFFAGNWAQHHYPAGSVFLDARRNPLPANRRGDAKLVAREDQSPWPEYDYFDRRWGANAKPLGYKYKGYNPNNRSIGIELLSYGSSQPSDKHYPPPMIAALADLVDDICQRHGIEKSRRTVCGHEDVNPVERWGWDPAAGFDWDRIVAPNTATV